MAIHMGLTNADSVGGVVIMPASFTGGRRRHVINYQDSMAMYRVYGLPDLFLTFTGNIRCRDITNALSFEPMWQPCDCYAQIMSVFHMKVDEFIQNIREGTSFDHVLAVAVEFEKRCLSSTMTAPNPTDAPTTHLDSPISKVAIGSSNNVADPNKTTKSQKSSTKKRTRASPTKKTAKKPFTNEDTMDGYADSATAVEP